MENPVKSGEPLHVFYEYVWQSWAKSNYLDRCNDYRNGTARERLVGEQSRVHFKWSGSAGNLQKAKTIEGYDIVWTYMKI